MARKNKAGVGRRGKHRKRDIEKGGDNNIVASRRLKVQMVFAFMSLVCFLLSFYFFGKGNVRESDPTKLDLIMIYSAYITPTLVFMMSYARRCLATNHPTWCFVVEMFQATLSSLTMTGSVQISIMKDEEKYFLWCLGFLLVSLILLEIAMDDTEDCGVCDMLLALFLTKWNAIHPKSVPAVCAISYYSRKIGIFTIDQSKNERPEAKDEEGEREGNKRKYEDVLKEMSDCWVSTNDMLASGSSKSDLKMKYPKFFRMRELIDEMHARH